MGKGTGYSAEFKARVASDAIRGEPTLSGLAARHGVPPNLIGQWKRQAIEKMASLLGGGGADAVKEKEAGVEKLDARIGQLLVERDFLAKAFGRQARIAG